ncbi:hypothetical protein [Rhodoplanes sp. SY1]|uniref:hypothetical protein n=1 Tax=Rhodoplanes sp. SY1 TaxID=3166646 RepID=UPI0038B65735
MILLGGAVATPRPPTWSMRRMRRPHAFIGMQHIIMPPQAIIIGMPLPIMVHMVWQHCMNMSFMDASIGVISHIMPVGVMVHFIVHIIMGIGIGIMPFIMPGIGIMPMFIIGMFMGMFIMGMPIIGIAVGIVGIVMAALIVWLRRCDGSSPSLVRD